MNIVEGMAGQFSFGKAEKHVVHVIRASMHACISLCQRRIALLFINHVHYYASLASTLFAVDRRLDHGLLWVKSRRWSSPLILPCTRDIRTSFWICHCRNKMDMPRTNAGRAITRFLLSLSCFPSWSPIPRSWNHTIPHWVTLYMHMPRTSYPQLFIN